MAVRVWRVMLEIGSYFGSRPGSASLAAAAATVARVRVELEHGGYAATLDPITLEGVSVCAPEDMQAAAFRYDTGARLALEKALNSAMHPPGRREAVWLAFDGFKRSGLLGSWARQTVRVIEGGRSQRWLRSLRPVNVVSGYLPQVRNDEITSARHHCRCAECEP